MGSHSLQSEQALNAAPAERPQARASWKIAFVHPTSWPQVRRGTERYMNELAAYMNSRGHQVKIICSHPGRRRVVRQDGCVTDYHRSLWRPFMARFGILDYHVFPLTTLASLLRERFDLVHCFNFTDALAACWTRRITGARVVLNFTSMPPSVSYRRALSAGGRILCRAIQAADGFITISRDQAAYFEARCARRSASIPAPVDSDVFALSREPRGPVIVCASALEDPRKGGRLLMRGFARLKEFRPDARLKIASAVSEALRNELLQLVPHPWRPHVEFLTDLETGDLPGLFGGAAVVVVPSLWETVSLVLLESLSTGTPVVATQQQDGSHEVLHPLVGRTFAPGPLNAAEASNVEGLAQAMLEALELSQRPETPMRCRQVAELYSWRSVGPRYEAIYREALGSRPQQPDAGGK